MLHTISVRVRSVRVRKQPLFPISRMTTSFAIALILVIPAHEQDGSAPKGGEMTYSKKQNFSRLRPLLTLLMLLMLIFARVSTVIACGPARK
jgi:hypothetical protein